MIVPLVNRSVDHAHCLHLATTVRKHLARRHGLGADSREAVHAMQAGLVAVIRAAIGE